MPESSEHYPFYGEGYLGYPYPPPYAYYRAPPTSAYGTGRAADRPLTYAENLSAYHGTTIRPRRPRSLSPRSDSSHSTASGEAHRAGDTKHAMLGDGDGDAHTVEAGEVVGTVPAIAATTEMETANISAKTPTTGRDDAHVLPLTEVCRLAETEARHAEKVSTLPSPSMNVPFFATTPRCGVHARFSANTYCSARQLQSPDVATDGEAQRPGCVKNEIGAGGPVQPGTCISCGECLNSTWRTQVDRVLAMLLNQVAGVEDAVGQVCEGIANIMGELEVMGRNASKYARVHSPSTTVHLEADGLNVGTSNLFEREQCGSQSNGAHGVDAVKTPECPTEQVQPEVERTPRKRMNSPILVDLDTLSNGSEEKTTPSEACDRTPDSRGKRVHCQPRLRAVPCARKLLVGASTVTIGDGGAGPHRSPTTYAPRYRNPPGYNNVTDFGASDEPYFKPPALQPKTNGVSRITTLCRNIFDKFTLLYESRSNLQECGFFECRPPYALAQGAGCCTLDTTFRWWGRPRQGSTTSRVASKRNWCPAARTASSTFSSKRYTAMTRLLYSPTTHISAQTRCAIALCGAQAIPGSGCGGGAGI